MAKTDEKVAKSTSDESRGRRKKKDVHRTTEQTDVLGRRAVAFIIDAAIAFALFQLFATAGGGSGQANGAGLLVAFVFTVGMQVIVQGATGRTPGKIPMGLIVVDEDGNPPGPSKAGMRTALWVIDGLPCGPLTGFIIANYDRAHRRLGDAVAHTFVVRKVDAGRTMELPPAPERKPTEPKTKKDKKDKKDGDKKEKRLRRSKKTKKGETLEESTTDSAEPNRGRRRKDNVETVGEESSPTEALDDEPAAPTFQPFPIPDAKDWEKPKPTPEEILSRPPVPKPYQPFPIPTRDDNEREKAAKAISTQKKDTTPQWDAEVGAYVQWDEMGQRWMQFDDVTQSWAPQG